MTYQEMKDQIVKIQDELYMIQRELRHERQRRNCR